MSIALVVDTETTDADPKAAQAFEVASIPVDVAHGLLQIEGPPRICRRNPGVPISLAASAVHHVFDSDLLGLPADFPELPAADYWIGHGVDFDWQVLGAPKNVRRICTLALARAEWPDLPAHNLTACYYHAVDCLTQEVRKLAQSAHSADADVRMTIVLLGEIVSKNQAESLEHLWQLSEAARVPSVMPWGKHKGTPLHMVPADYRGWLLRQDDLDPYLRGALEGLR